jgi:sortase A
MDDAPVMLPSARPRPRPLARAVRWLGTGMVILGVGVLAWSVVVWRWEDPFTSVYTAYEQHRLDSQLATVMSRHPVSRPPTTESPPAVAARIRSEARAFRRQVKPGEAIGRILVPRLGLDMVLVEGTDEASLKKGPGRDARTFMPGEGKLVYVAGHRTTYAAPFAAIDTMRQGDKITVVMPYGTFVYKVNRYRIVAADDLSVLRSDAGEEIALQACHPRFFATQRYIVWAVPTRSTKLDGRVVAEPVAH